jgi:TetR/AcrR family transcriptional regulator, regulator of cefoperazone and chloramphenicol sensitivity
MPRNATDTRQRLIDAGRELFARSGVYTTSSKAVIDAAGQRNTSALHYHFGGRDGLLEAIIDSSNAGIEAEREALLDAAAQPINLAVLVEAVVLPQARLLHNPEGRQFLSIVSQLSDLFDRWEEQGAAPPPALRAFRAIKAILPGDLSEALRHERVTRFLELVSEALGSRARMLEAGRSPALPHEIWVANLAAMAVGALRADSDVGPSATTGSF